MKVLLELFWSFFQVGLFSIGGGMASLPLIQHQVVDIHSWLTISEFTDLITISEMTPGPIAINAATFVGTNIAGVPGAIVATIGSILPSILIVSLLTWAYIKFKNLKVIQGVFTGLRPAIIALIASALITILVIALWGENGFSWNISKINIISAVLFLGSLFILQKYKVNPVIVMLICGIINGAIYLIF